MTVMSFGVLENTQIPSICGWVAEALFSGVVLFLHVFVVRSYPRLVPQRSTSNESTATGPFPAWFTLGRKIGCFKWVKIQAGQRLHEAKERHVTSHQEKHPGREYLHVAVFGGISFSSCTGLGSGSGQKSYLAGLEETIWELANRFWPFAGPRRPKTSPHPH